jgi:hypothetical protein
MQNLLIALLHVARCIFFCGMRVLFSLLPEAFYLPLMSFVTAAILCLLLHHISPHLPDLH